MTTAMMQPDETQDILLQTGALHTGHYVQPDGKHTDHYFQMTQAMGQFNNWRRLCVGLSRVLRLAPEVSSVLPNVTVVAPSTGGIAVAFGVREALSADQIVWAERDNKGLHFRQFAEVGKGEKCILVDDILRTGSTLKQCVQLIRQSGGSVLCIAVVVDARLNDVDFGGIPLYSLVKMKAECYPEGRDCPLCAKGVALETVSM